MKTKQKDVLTADTTLGQIFNRNSYAQELLRSIGFKPDGQTEKTLRQICSERQWSENEVLEWIGHHEEKETTPSPTFVENLFNNDVSVSEVCHYLKKETIPEIETLLAKVKKEYARVLKIHGIQYPWLKEAAPYVDQLTDKLQYLIYFEKMTFYPLVDEYSHQKEKILDRDVQNLKRSVQIVRDDHQTIQKSIHHINRLSKGLNYPESACSTFRIATNQLRMLIDLVGRHFDIEDKHLLPTLESKL